MASRFSDGQFTLRPANKDEGPFLTELALRSKGHWEYDSEFLRDCRTDLTITPEFISANEVFVIEANGASVGFFSLERQNDDNVELEHLYVEPRAIGGGLGKQLFLHAVETARQLGFRSMTIKSDPFAESFYEAMGARRIGEVESPVRPGRMLPRLRFKISP